MSDELANLFHGELPLFEQRGRPNGYTTWSAREVAKMLGYEDFATFKRVIKKAQQVLLTLNIEITEHFNQEVVVENGRSITDIRLSRFGFYLVAMNGDVKKKAVAAAQYYFGRFSELCQRWLDDAEPVERVLIRKEISSHEKTLSATAKHAGVKDYAHFRNAGYRGLYNMNLCDLKKRKGIPDDRTPLDFMGKDELAANLFWSTQTDAKIKRDNIRGQSGLEAAAEGVGKTVRATMEEISGQKPEDLPAQEDILVVKAGLKRNSETLKHGQPSDLNQLPVPSEDEHLKAPDED